jgi:hypothetical protein
VLAPVLIVVWCPRLAAQAGTQAAPRQGAAPGAFKQDFLWSGSFSNRLRVDAFADYSYVGAGEVKFAGADGRTSDAQSVNVAVNGEIPASRERWFVPVGLGSENILLEALPGLPIPEGVHTLRLSTGVGCRFNEQWLAVLSLGPMLYRVEDLEGDDIGIAGMVRVNWRIQPDLTASFGLAFNPDSDIPVFPALGVRYVMRTNVILNLMMPKPGVIYRASPRLSLFAGGGLKGATFRTDPAFGTRMGQPRFDHELASYWDVRFGLGVDYGFTRLLSLTVEGGYSVWRLLDYKELEETVRFEPAPCVQAGVRLRF